MTMVPGAMVSAGGAARTVVKTQSFSLRVSYAPRPSCGMFSPIDDEMIFNNPKSQVLHANPTPSSPEVGTLISAGTSSPTKALGPFAN
jgi:hypothetical protein